MGERLIQRKKYAVALQKRTASDLILDYLLQIDVDRIFGITGDAIQPLFDAIARLQRHDTATENDSFAHKTQRRRISRQQNKHAKLKMIVARHEAGAAFMADGYSRETGRLGVCFSTTGPGSANLITAIASAYVNRIPMLVITPQTALPDFGKRNAQGNLGDSVNIVEMLNSCTRYNTFVSHIDQLEGKIFQAICTAFRPPFGPVHLSIPVDIMNQQMENKQSSFHVAAMLRQSKSYDQQSLERLSSLLRKSEKVVFFLDAGCLKHAKVVVRFAEVINAKIVTSPAGKGCVSAYHPLYRGVFGFAGHKSANDTLMSEKVDIVLAIGTTLSEFEVSGWWNASLLNKKLIHIDATSENFSHSPMARLHVHGHLGFLFAKLINEFSKYVTKNNNTASVLDASPPTMGLRPIPDSCSTPFMPSVIANNNLHCDFNEAADLSFVKPKFLMCELARKAPVNARFYIDSGNSWAWATHYLHLKNTACYRTGMAYGAMTWAIGAAIGSAAAGGQPAICITGGSAYLMSAQEITVAVEHQLPVIFIILNDQAQGVVKRGQRQDENEQMAFELPPVDFSLMAGSVGASAMTVRTVDEFANIDFNSLCQHRGPTLIDIHIDPEEIPFI